MDNLNEELQLRYTLRESDKQNITQKLHNLDLSINNEDSKPSKLKEISTLSPKSDKDGKCFRIITYNILNTFFRFWTIYKSATISTICGK